MSAVGQVMNVTGADHAWLQQDVFLHVLLQLGEGLQVSALTLWTALGCGKLEAEVNLFGFGPLPGRMAYGSATLFALSRRTGRRGGGSFAAFKLAAMQRLELSLKLVIFQF